jgi:hypothetical protein
VSKLSLTTDSSEFLEDFFLPPVQMGWNFDDGLDYLIAFSITPQMRYSFTFQSEYFSALGTFRDFQNLVSFQSGNFYRSTQGGLGNRNRNLAIDVISLPLKELMSPHMKKDIQITIRAATLSFLPLSSQPKPGA